jgi:hypothetical protein
LISQLNRFTILNKSSIIDSLFLVKDLPSYQFDIQKFGPPSIDFRMKINFLLVLPLSQGFLHYSFDQCSVLSEVQVIFLESFLPGSEMADYLT